MLLVSFLVGLMTYQHPSSYIGHISEKKNYVNLFTSALRQIQFVFLTVLRLLHKISKRD